jgi:hypothetical protein
MREFKETESETMIRACATEESKARARFIYKQ